MTITEFYSKIQITVNIKQVLLPKHYIEMTFTEFYLKIQITVNIKQVYRNVK